MRLSGSLRLVPADWRARQKPNNEISVLNDRNQLRQPSLMQKTATNFFIDRSHIYIRYFYFCIYQTPIET